MNYEEKFNELNERIAKLEKAEKQRTIKKYTKLALGLAKYAIIIILIFMAYKTYIKPYKEKIDFVEEKVDTVQKFIDEKLGSLKSLIR